MKPFTTMACILLLLIAFLQSIRVLLGWEIIVNGHAVPIWASAMAALLAGALSLLALRESRR